MDSPLVIRADASPQIGTGHVMRCLALAQAWPGEVIFLSHDLPPSLHQRLLDQYIHVVSIEAPLDLQPVLAVMEQYAAPWLVLDGYHFGTDYQRSIRQAGKRLFLLDDYAHWPAYEADILLNQNVTASGIAYPLNRDALLLSGTRYCLLRPEFQQRPIQEPAAVAHRLLITLGGSDPENVTLRILQALSTVPSMEIKVVVGAANLHRVTLEQAARHHVEILVDVKDMPSLLQWADIAITAGGTTCLEVAFTGLPALLITIAENHAAIVTRLGELGAMISLGWAQDLSMTALAAQVQALAQDQTRRAEMRQLQQMMVDGQGAKRVAQILQTEKPEAVIRPAQLEDAYLVWEWANDPVTRANSFNAQPIPWSAHFPWWQHKLAAAAARIWLLEYHHVPVALIRYDRKNDTTATISFQVAPGYRGRGFGTQILAMTGDWARQALGVTTLEGMTFTHNMASIRSFQKNGYKQAQGAIIAEHPTYIFTQTG